MPKSTSLNEAEPLAVEAWCDENTLHVRLADAREIAVPLDWFPRLRDATPEATAALAADRWGIGLHWEDVDEDISVDGLLATR
jgi:Protein of unknown function (DUF2442)